LDGKKEGPAGGEVGDGEVGKHQKPALKPLNKKGRGGSGNQEEGFGNRTRYFSDLERGRWGWE